MKEEENVLRVTVKTPTETADEYMKNLSVTASSQTTTIAKISVNDLVKEHHVDFVNRLGLQHSTIKMQTMKRSRGVTEKTANWCSKRIAYA